MTIDVIPCIFCCRKGNLTDQTQNQSLTLFFKNLQLLFNFQPNYEILNSLDSPNLLVEYCADCLSVVESFCEIFHQIKCFELRLQWKVDTLVKIIEQSEKVPSRQEQFKQLCDQLDNQNKSVYKSILGLRREITKQCSKRLPTSTFPKVRLKKVCLPEETKFCQSDTSDTSCFEPKDESAYDGHDDDTDNLSVVSVDDHDEESRSDCTSEVSEVSEDVAEGKSQTSVKVKETDDDDDDHDHEQNEKKFICKDCPVQLAFSSYASILRHRFNEHRDNPRYFPFKCPEKNCNIRLTSKRGLSRHKFFWHKDDQTKEVEAVKKKKAQISEKHRCGICSKVFQRKDLLALHKLGHKTKAGGGGSGAGAKAKSRYYLKCELCPGRKFVGVKRLQNHKRVIHGSAINNDNAIETDTVEANVENESDSEFENRQIVEVKMELLPCKVRGCKERFTLPEELENHSKLHGSFKCVKCPTVVKFAPDLAIHEAESHIFPGMKMETDDNLRNKSKDFQCLRCKFRICRISRWKDAYIKHLLESHLNLSWATFICHICRKSYLPEKGVKARNKKRSWHFQTFHGQGHGDEMPEGSHRCDQDECPAYFKTITQLRAHRKEIHSEKFTCSECGREFKSRTNRKLHMLKIHKINLAISCSVQGCTMKFLDQEELAYHKMIKHKKSEKIFKCSQCSQTFTDFCEYFKHTVASHPKTKSRQNAFVCEKCGKKLTTKYGLKQHYLTHAGPEGWEFCCDTCGKKCMTNQKLENHKMTHAKGNDKIMFQCDICGEKYAHVHNLRNHVKSKHS